MLLMKISFKLRSLLNGGSAGPMHRAFNGVDVGPTYGIGFM